MRGGIVTSGDLRIAGIDIARGLAILGMFVAHAIPRPDDDIELLVDGRSSILFATLAGVSLGIITGGAHTAERGRRGDLVVSILLRAICLFLLGSFLAALNSEIAIILDYYSFMFVLLTPLLFLNRWALAAIAAVLVVAAPALAASTAEPDDADESFISFLQYYLLDGSYPALVWMPFLIAGLISVRSGLGRTGTQFAMVSGGTLVAVVGYGLGRLPGWTAEAHSSTTAEVLGSGGFAIAVIGAVLWLTSPERAGFGRAVRGILWPVGATGSMALTVYTAQILTLAIFVQLRNDSGGQVQYPGWPLLIGLTVASLLFASVWRATLGKGPLERLLTLISRPRKRRTDTSAPV